MPQQTDAARVGMGATAAGTKLQGSSWLARPRAGRCRQELLQLASRLRVARQVCCASPAVGGVLLRLFCPARLPCVPCCTLAGVLAVAQARSTACKLASSLDPRITGQNRVVLLLLLPLPLPPLLPEKTQWLEKGVSMREFSLPELDGLVQAPWCQERQSSKRLASKSTSECMRNVVMKGVESKRASATQGWMQFCNSGSLELGLGQRLHSLAGRSVLPCLWTYFFRRCRVLPESHNKFCTRRKSSQVKK